MAKFKLYNNISLDPRMERHALTNKFNTARINLVAVVIFTAINIVMLATGAGSYFLFSASVPYVITTYGLLLCGMLPEEYYEGLEGMFFLDPSFFYITLAVSVLILAMYLLCFFLSKKKISWLKTALILFIIDSVVMILYYGIDLSMILDYVFHGYVIYILISGINAHKKLKSMPKEEEIIEATYTEVYDSESETQGEEPIAASIDSPDENKNNNNNDNDGFPSAGGPLDI